MKSVVKKISLLAFVMIVFAVSLLAQEGKKIIAVINRADWCPVCQANGEKMMNEVMPVFKESTVQFMMNDLTNENTKEDSKKMLTDKNVYAAVEKTTSTGVLLLVDLATGKLLEKISVTESAEKIIEIIRKMSKVEKM